MIERARDQAAAATGFLPDPDLKEGPATAAWQDSAFELHAKRHRRELHVHCYRMLASFTKPRTRSRRRS